VFRSVRSESAITTARAKKRSRLLRSLPSRLVEAEISVFEAGQMGAPASC